MSEATADYLATRQWAPLHDEPQRTATIPNTALNTTTPEYNTTDITDEELSRALRTAKKGKACGPDHIPVELLQNLPPSGHNILLTKLNQWWNTGAVHADHLQA